MTLPRIPADLPRHHEIWQGVREAVALVSLAAIVNSEAWRDVLVRKHRVAEKDEDAMKNNWDLTPRFILTIDRRTVVVERYERGKVFTKWARDLIQLLFTKKRASARGWGCQEAKDRILTKTTDTNVHAQCINRSIPVVVRLDVDDMPALELALETLQKIYSKQ